jgi:hypothetical protein
MKKKIKLLALVLATMMLVSTTTLADDDTENKPTLETTTGVTATLGEDEDQIQVTYTTTTTEGGSGLVAGQQYLVLMVKSDENDNYTISESSILYIDQTAATASDDGTKVSVSFTVYPSAMLDSVILIAGVGVNGGTGPLKAVIVDVKYVLGDLNEDGVINVGDAMLLLQYVAGLTTLSGSQLQAANVNGAGAVDVGDAMLLLQVVAGLASLG